MNWLDASTMTALARALLHFLWEGAAIALLLQVVLAALGPGSAQARYVAACSAMAAMAASFAATLAMPGEPGQVWAIAPKLLTAAVDAQTSPGPAAPVEWPLRSWAVALWGAGVAVLLTRRLGGWAQMQRLRHRGAVATDCFWLLRLAGMRRRIGVTRAVALVESALVEAPLVMGVLRPAILIPAGWLMQLPAEQVEAVLLHELAHVRRHDYLVNLLQSVVEDLLFYHPAVWWVGRVIRRERENCCDDCVIAMGGDRGKYARTLAAMEGLRAGSPAPAANGGNLAGRIRRLVRPVAAPRASAMPLLVAMGLVCAGAAALPAWQTPPSPPRPPKAADAQDTPVPPTPPPPPARRSNVPPTPPPPPPPAAQSDDLSQGPYLKWLQEDVAYIISDDERAAFRRLQSNEEREHFIEQFWARRDPTPGTVENEFKEEHYRRIGYTNEQFRDPRIAGWKTDRGRVYITYGPPDEKETHPTGERGGPPYEQWLFRHLEGIGDNIIIQFEDAERNGQYRMTRDPRGGRAQANPLAPAAFDALQRPPRLGGVAMPGIQPEGDYLFTADGVKVRVGVGGATLIEVQGDGEISVNRVTRHDGGGEMIVERQHAAGSYSKLLILPPGQYRVQAEVRATVAADAAAMGRLSAEVEAKRAILGKLRETMTENHPDVRRAEAELSTAEARLAQRENQLRLRDGQVRTAQLEFRVP